MDTNQFYNGKYWDKGWATKPKDMARIDRIIKKIERLSEYMKNPILDVGCGRGHVVNRLAKLGYKIEGSDISSAVLREAKTTYPGLVFFKHNFEESPLDKKYGTIISTEVVEHLFDYNIFLKNIALSLESEGHLILTTPNVLGLRNRLSFIKGNGRLFKQMAHIRYFTPKTMTEVLQKNGFKDVRIIGYSSIPILPKSCCGNMLIVASV